MPSFTVESWWGDQTQQGGGGGGGDLAEVLAPDDEAGMSLGKLRRPDIACAMDNCFPDYAMQRTPEYQSGLLRGAAVGAAVDLVGIAGVAAAPGLLDGLSLTAPEVGLVGGGTGAVAAANSDRLVLVSRWGSEGLKAGDWVMTGGKTAVNYVLSGKWQPGMGNMFAPFSSGQSYTVPLSSLQMPQEFVLTDWFKALLGQRMYSP